MICSTGASGSSTPIGTFVMPNKRYSSERTEWYFTMDVYVKYPSRIYKGILFHSVPFSSRNDATLQWSEYNKLGSPASHGCIRLRVDDSKWIADNCPPGTVVYIYRSGARNDIVRSVLLEVGSYSIDLGLSYNQFIGLSDDPDTLDRASSGPEVQELQSLLLSLGFNRYTYRARPTAPTIPSPSRPWPLSRRPWVWRRPALPTARRAIWPASPDAPTGTRTTFRVGMSGRAVEKLQAALKALKLYDGPVDGQYTQRPRRRRDLFAGISILPENGEGRPGAAGGGPVPCRASVRAPLRRARTTSFWS